MKKFFAVFTVLLCLLTATTALAASRNSPMSQQRDISVSSSRTLEKLYAQKKDARELLSLSYGYATISNSGGKSFTGESNSGHGIAYDYNGKKIFLTIRHGKYQRAEKINYELVFVFYSKKNWENFIANQTKFFTKETSVIMDDGNLSRYGKLLWQTNPKVVADGVYAFKVDKGSYDIFTLLNDMKIYKMK